MPYDADLARLISQHAKTQVVAELLSELGLRDVAGAQEAVHKALEGVHELLVMYANEINDRMGLEETTTKEMSLSDLSAHAHTLEILSCEDPRYKFPKSLKAAADLIREWVDQVQFCAIQIDNCIGSGASEAYHRRGYRSALAEAIRASKGAPLPPLPSSKEIMGANTPHALRKLQRRLRAALTAHVPGAARMRDELQYQIGMIMA